MAIKNFSSSDFNKLKKGDSESLRKIYNLLRNQLVSFLKGYVSDEESIKEIIQDVFVKLWENREKINSEESLLNYIYTIAKNHVIDILRKKRLKFVDFENINESELNNSNTTSETIEYKELEEIINDGINKLSDRKKEVFLLHRTDKLTYPEISEKLNISISAVEKNISSALKELRNYIFLQQK